MNLVGLPMASSVAFKKLSAAAKKASNSESNVSKSSGGLANFDKKQLAEGVRASKQHCVCQTGRKSVCAALFLIYLVY